MDNIELKGAAQNTMLVVPAQSRTAGGEALSFLFSIVQLDDIVNGISPSQVPFSPPYLDGLARWRKQVLPVILLEVLLGLTQAPVSYGGNRAIVINKSGGMGEPENWQRAMLRIAPGSRMLNEIPKAEPVAPGEHLPAGAADGVRGTYRWEGGLLLVPNMEIILSGKLTHV